MPKKPPLNPRRRRPGQTAVRSIAIGLAVVLALVFGAQFLLRTPGFVLAPNAERSILLVTIDTLRADAVGSYGGRALTPNLDGLAARGARFTFAHAHAVVTLPSHASILSGRYPYEHGIRDNTGYRFPAATPTLATQLKARGFATGAFIGGFPLDRRFGLDAGFDVYDDRLGAAADDERRARAARGCRRVVGPRVDRPAAGTVVRVGARVRPARHVRGAAGMGVTLSRRIRTWPRSPGRTPRSVPCSIGSRTQPRPTLVIATADHGEGLGDHGEKTHSVFAYETHAARAAHHRRSRGGDRPARRAA